MKQYSQRTVARCTFEEIAVFDFENRVLVLTGANGGIGRAVAGLFLAHGARLVLGDRDAAALAEFADSLDPTRERIVTTAMDAANSDDAQHLVDLAASKFGGIDFLVPSAGVYFAQPIREMTDRQWRQTLAINLDGMFYICQRALPMLHEDSSIVTLTSVAAHRGAFTNAHYSASKGGVLSLTRSLARELGPRTRVNAVSPGVIETPMTKDLVRDRGSESISQTPLRRLGRPEEVASAIGFLCSGAASFITGEVLHVNGGLYIAG
jgi:3-oxoacyl-[acyl-carrier protein] reductase